MTDPDRLPRSVLATVAVVLLALAAFLVLLPAPGGSEAEGAGAAQRPPTSPAPSSETTESTTVTGTMARRSWGVTTRSLPGDLRAVRALARRTGRAPDRLMWYAAWSDVADFPAADARRVADLGALPEISWEPWDPAAGADQPAYAAERVVAGDHDRYLRRWARQAAAYGDPVVIRLAHAMNGDWYPWGAARPGNRPDEFVAAWRHVVGVFRDHGATNVAWSWSPNIPYEGGADLAALFPGDAWVDRVGLDGYNWAGFRPGTTWRSFEEVVDEGVAALGALSDRPVYVAEVGTPERGGDKAAWVRGMFAYADSHPELRGLTWFDIRKRADWRVASSRESLRAFRRGLADYG